MARWDNSSGPPVAAHLLLLYFPNEREPVSLLALSCSKQRDKEHCWYVPHCCPYPMNANRKLQSCLA
uniref:Uncharacterized protein n=1 Tax=Picea glauca TaxID=3330 RepID=A0A124GMG0_PICGL|nr:hypothetical protein ABT39_MTgene2396 [Picea glauca]QHR88976.1 hypothetical protein Q903MT_gene2995 [Picea sitchensis]